MLRRGWMLSMSLLCLLVSAQAMAQSAKGWPQPLSPLEAQEEADQDAAVLIGVEDYVFVPDVPGAATNVNDWYSYLRKTRQVPRQNMVLLRNQEATLEGIQDALNQALERVGPEGTLWFVFVGHGAPSATGDQGVLIGVDAQQNARSLYARSLPQKSLMSKIESGKQARSVVMLDACFSGRGTQGEPLVPGLQPLLPSSDAPAPESNKTIVLTAGRGEDFAGTLPGAGRPAFSYLMLGAMRGWADQNKDSVVTTTEALTYSREALRLTVKGRRQIPQQIQGDGAFSLSEGATEEGPDLDQIVLELDTLPPTVLGSMAPGTVFPPVYRDPVVEQSFFRLTAGFQWLPRTFLMGNSLSGDTTYGSTVELPSGSRGSSDLDWGQTDDVMQAYHFSGSLVAFKEGFGLTTTIGVTWSPDLENHVTVSGTEEQDPGEEDLEQLFAAGEKLRVRGVFLANMEIELHYRLRLADWALFAQTGLGFVSGSVTIVDEITTTDPDKPSIKDFEEPIGRDIFALSLPMRLGVEYNIYKTYGINMIYSYFLYPDAVQQFRMGVTFGF